MAGITHSSLRRGLAALVLGGAIAAGAGMVVGTQHAAAVGIPTKTCVGPSSGAAQPGKADVCTVSILGILANGDQYVVQPATPAGAVISACAGTTVTTPFAYTTTAAVTSNACTWTVSGVTAAAAGNLVLGTETLQISPATKSGTSVTQTMAVLDLPPPVVGGTLDMRSFHPHGHEWNRFLCRWRGPADRRRVPACQSADHAHAHADADRVLQRWGHHHHGQRHHVRRSPGSVHHVDPIHLGSAASPPGSSHAGCGRWWIARPRRPGRTEVAATPPRPVNP